MGYKVIDIIDIIDYKNSIFDLNGRLFRKGNLRRTRFYCTEIDSNKGYLVHGLAQVKEIKDGK